MTRRDVWFIVISLALGPLFGGVTFLVFAATTDNFITHGQIAFPSIIDFWPVIMMAAYTLGAIPALLSAVAMAFLSRRLPRLGQRLVAAPLVGAAISLAIVGFVVFSDDHAAVDDWMILTAIALTGAVAGFLCLAIVEAWHPLPKPAVPAP